jgi:hypothetical protein
MIATDATVGQVTSGLEIGVGLTSHPDSESAVARAAALAASRLHGVTADLAVVLTAGAPETNVVGSVRGALGPVAVAGGATSALLTDHGPMTDGAVVICIANADGATSGVAATAGRTLADAGQAAARLILAGWPFRARYPRGLGIAFARSGSEVSPRGFLEPWRSFMGPKMRTVCSVLSSGVVYGRADGETALVSVACLEAPYSTGLGYTDMAGADGNLADVETLIHGAADATLTAIKRLDGRPARLVMVIESAARHRALGSAAADEWAAMRGEMDDRTMCVGWLCEDVAGYGRGVQPTDGAGSLVVVALGDAPRP